jgi:hypothetical protein
MVALTKRQSTQSLVMAWFLAAAAYVASDPNTGDHLPYLLTMSTIETEFMERGVKLCNDCGGPEGYHMDMPGLHDEVTA